MFDQQDRKNDIKFRAKVIFEIILALSTISVINLYRLQISNADKYLLMSNKNRIRLAPIVPRRGRIVTADGEIVATNICQYKLVMERSDAKTFRENMKIIRQCLTISEEDAASLNEARRKKYPFIIVKDRLSWEEYSKLSMVLFKLNGVSITNTYSRNYPVGPEFAHIAGYASGSSRDASIYNGKSGIEHYANEQLRGKFGNIQTEVNATGKRVKIIDSLEPTVGEDIILTIDSRLQKYVYDTLSLERAGAAVVLDLSSGEVLAMVSIPSFDPNLFSQGMTKTQWQEVTGNPMFPLINRAVNCSYPPGSIFKIVVAFAALCEGIISPKDRIYCSGGIKLEDRVFHCWNRAGHGYMNLTDALRFSCDCYFFEISRRLGIDRIVGYAEKLGLGSETGLELPTENSGLLPTRRWKFLHYGTTWKPYETMLAGIGQGALLATPLQLATMLGKIYAGNTDFSPTLIKNQRKNKKFDIKNTLDSRHLTIIKDALRQVCTSGTAARSCNTDYGISGKTGSSQVKKIKSHEVGMSQSRIPWKWRDHALFVGCAPVPNSRYVVAVFVEHGGGGASVAAPIARKIFDWLLLTTPPEKKSQRQDANE
ncbi:MAG: penicillin-binding protein 2 [Holosporaceae bacterium]|nr:penicillin-binding protein 2 [Holosporaceae bacterium]